MSPENVDFYDKQRELISKNDLQLLQVKKIRETLSLVYEKSRFYRSKFNEKRVHPDDFRKLEDIKKFPYTTKDDLRDFAYPYGGDFLCVPKENLACWHMTSGTTGKPTVGPYTLHDYDQWMEVMARSYVTAGVRKGDIVMNIYGYGLFTGGLGFHQSAFRVGATVIPWSSGRTDALIQTLRDFKASVMTGTPSYQYLISEKIQSLGIDAEKDLSLRVTIPGAEVWSEEMRKRLEDGFALKQHGGGSRNVYGATELCGPGAGQECVYENGFHFWTDQWYLEIIDSQTNEQVSPGEQGEMVATHLNREGMPLVRYRLRDLTVIDDSGCECGRNAYPRCLWIRGRTDDVIHYKGAKIYPTAIQEALMKFPEIAEYQIVVDKTKSEYSFEISIELGTEPGPELEKRIDSELNKVLFARPKVTFAPKGTLPRYEGKSKRIIEKM